MSQPDNNLPFQLTSLVGRRREIAEIGRLLAEARLLTLTGPGGCGKTRLALAVAARVLEGFEDGVWLVELASLSDPELVPQAAASVLGVREMPGTTLTESLTAYLGSRKTLLVLDNCEHLVEASAPLAEALLRSCPNLSILATSREALGVPGEILFAVPPLSLPDPRHLQGVDGLSHYEAARLFVERAKALKSGFEVTEQNAMAVAQVCYRLDGMPLAIELAAARTKVLPVEQISARLEKSLRLLSGGGRTAMPHHRTLIATMEWSHELLDRGERTLFRRLCVFAGFFAFRGSGTGDVQPHDVQSPKRVAGARLFTASRNSRYSPLCASRTLKKPYIASPDLQAAKCQHLSSQHLSTSRRPSAREVCSCSFLFRADGSGVKTSRGPRHLSDRAKF